MDWNSEEGRALLRLAYPVGVLNVAGVTSVAGWCCVHVDPPDGDRAGTAWWLRILPPVAPHCSSRCSDALAMFLYETLDGVSFLRDPRHDDADDAVLRRALAEGDLLPLPDPQDVATWACLLADLAAAIEVTPERAQEQGGVTIFQRKPWTGFAWHRYEPEEPGDVPAGMARWTLAVFDAGGVCHFDIYLPDGVSDADGGAEALIRARAQLHTEGR